MHHLRLTARIGVLIAAATSLMLLASIPADAHEDRAIGKWHFGVGWGDEPAYAGFRNSVELLLHDADDKPVVDLGDTLNVEVTFGSAPPLKLALEPNFELGESGIPGDYRAWLVPTRSGDYSFHFTGTIKGDKIDATFRSSKTTFDPVKDVSEVEYPQKDPSNADLAGRIERAVPRIDSRDAALAASLAKARNAASFARALAIAGLALAAVAFSAAVRRRRSS